MRGAVPVLFAAHLIKLAITRQVSASNPALRIPSTVRCNRDTCGNLDNHSIKCSNPCKH